MRVSEHVTPRLEETDEFDVPSIQELRAQRILVQPGDVALEVLDATPETALGGGEPELLGVIAKHRVGLHELRVVLIAGDLREMILQHACRFANGENDAELPARIVVGEQLGSPEEEVVRPPARHRIELVPHHRGDRRRHALPRLRVCDVRVETE